MDTASCKTAPTICVTLEISPWTMLDPMFMTMAAPMATSAMRGCRKLVVASVMTKKTTSTASGTIMERSRCTLSTTLAFVAAEPSMAQALAPSTARASARMLSTWLSSPVAAMVSWKR